MHERKENIKVQNVDVDMFCDFRLVLFFSFIQLDKFEDILSFHLSSDRGDVNEIVDGIVERREKTSVEVFPGE